MDLISILKGSLWLLCREQVVERQGGKERRQEASATAQASDDGGSAAGSSRGEKGRQCQQIY